MLLLHEHDKKYKIVMLNKLKFSIVARKKKKKKMTFLKVLFLSAVSEHTDANVRSVNE